MPRDTPLCYKYFLITHVKGFLGAKLLARLRIRKILGVLCEPWLLRSVEGVYLFGGVGVVDFTFDYWGKWFINVVCMIGTITLIKSEPTHFHAYIMNIVGLLLLYL